MGIGIQNHIKALALGFGVCFGAFMITLFLGVGIGGAIGPIAVVVGLAAGTGTYIWGIKFKSNVYAKRFNEIKEITSLSNSHNEHLNDIVTKLNSSEYSLFRGKVLDNFSETMDKRKVISYLQMWADDSIKEIRKIKAEQEALRRQEDNARKERELEILREREHHRRVRNVPQMSYNEYDVSNESYQETYEDRDSRAFGYFNQEGLTSDRVNEITGVKQNLNPKRVEELTGVRGNLTKNKVKKILK